MRKNRSLLYHVIIFILAQLAWLSLLGLWIYWYVYNYLVFKKVGNQISPQLSYDTTNVVPFVVGLVLLVGLSLITTWIFRNLNVQLRLNKLYDNFIGNITHELKSPLSSIQLYLETLKSRDVPPEKQKEFIDFMIKDGNRLQRLINSILEISALEQKKLAHNYQVYDAEPLLKQLFIEMAEQFRLPQDTITIDGKADCKIVADKLALKIIFDNLLDNALKYSLNSLKINVKLNCNEKIFTIEFSDNGIGIPQLERKKIFNKFYRIYRRDIPNVKGTGLGLYWVREIVRNHGGKISVASEGEKKGTTFTIELPVYQASKKRFVNKLLTKAKSNKQITLSDE
ncbi:alkaline phosphatase synthesis sensor protein PhoR [bacterium BMS3Abin03]|nr:alkaline phosphatase synthesis sensor protein PhoR [bacterium BMS3Abin03]